MYVIVGGIFSNAYESLDLKDAHVCIFGPDALKTKNALIYLDEMYKSKKVMQARGMLPGILIEESPTKAL